MSKLWNWLKKLHFHKWETNRLAKKIGMINYLYEIKTCEICTKKIDYIIGWDSESCSLNPKDYYPRSYEDS